MEADVPVDMGLLLIDALSAVAGGHHKLLSVQRKCAGKDLIRYMALELRKADSHQNGQKGEDVASLLCALALEPRKADGHQNGQKGEDVASLLGALALKTP
jgi:hypothetical protein